VVVAKHLSPRAVVVPGPAMGVAPPRARPRVARALDALCLVVVKEDCLREGRLVLLAPLLALGEHAGAEVAEVARLWGMMMSSHSLSFLYLWAHATDKK